MTTTSTSACGSRHSVKVTDVAASAPVELISLENTLNGTIFPQDEIIRISEFARKHDLKMHLDGARIWHVAAETIGYNI